ncbi:MAG: hypothetical protein JNM66_33990 [Bryobacterales bacterium]|nr:hypothetical protein [Bryobacterales bacterium]
MEYIVQLTAVVGTIGLLWLTLQALRRFRTGRIQCQRVLVQQRISVSNGCQLVVIRWDGQDMLLATGAQACTVVASKPTAETESPREVRGAWAH